MTVLVANRTREMGIRLAIGAEPRAVVRLIMGQAMAPVVAGLVVGLFSAKAAARLVESGLVRLDTSDPWPLVLAGLVVLVASSLAAFVPARRAARADPAMVLRAE